jgi:hypothetical protein
VGATFVCDLNVPWNDRNLFRVESIGFRKASTIFLNDSSGTQDIAGVAESRSVTGLSSMSVCCTPGAFGDDWEADSFALSKGEIIRIYRNRQFAIVFRFLARSGTLLDHPIFKRLVKDISFDPKCREKTAPTVTEKRKRNKIEDSPLPMDEMDELKQITRTAAKRLGITSKTSHTKRLEVVEMEIEKHRRVKGSTQGANVQLATELGAVIGQCFSEKLAWEWRRLKVGRDPASVCACCPERRLVLTPGAWVPGLLSSKKQPVNCLLTFNMIDQGRLPPTRPDAYVRIN